MATQRVRTYMDQDVIATVYARFEDDCSAVESFRVKVSDRDTGLEVGTAIFPATTPAYQAKALTYASFCASGPGASVN